MKKRKIKAYISKCTKRFRIIVYSLLALMLITFSILYYYQVNKYNKLRQEIWDKIENTLDEMHK
jgi:cytochrome c-type biogenesis protein CcmH/NrfG